jgi:hypothetical protein
MTSNNSDKEKVLDSLVDKLCKKVNFNEEDPNLKKIANTNIFKHLMNKLDQDQLPFEKEKKEKENFDKNTNIKIENNQEDLPRFGGSNKKVGIDPNRYDSQGKERVKSTNSKTHSVEEFNNDHSNHSANKQSKNLVSIQNPNNTMTKNESQNDDSLFKSY